MLRLKPDTTTGRQQPRPLVVSEHHVQILDGLAGRAFHEVIDDRHKQDPAAGRVHAPPDVAEIRIRRVLDLRQRLTGQSYERCCLIGRFHRVGHITRRRARPHARVDRFENAPVERHEVRHERDGRAQFLFDFGLMPMTEHAVCGHAPVILGKMRPVARLLARARDPRLCVDHDVACQQSGLGQRLERKQRGGGVAARVRNELCRPDLSVIALCEAVYRLQGAQLRRWIPFLARGRVAQPERAGQVYDADAAADEDWSDGRRRFLRQGQENDVGLVGQFLRRKRLDDAVPDSREGRQRARRSVRRRRHRRRDADARVSSQPSQQLLTGEAARAGNADPYRMSRCCP